MNPQFGGRGWHPGRRRAWFWGGLVAGVTVLLLLLSSCATVTTRAKDDASAVLLVREVGLLGFRQEAWAEVRNLMKLTESLPAGQFPGWTAFRADITAALARPENANAVKILGPKEFDTLLRQNPHFWQAVLETDPRDPLIPICWNLAEMGAGRRTRAERGWALMNHVLPMHPIAGTATRHYEERAQLATRVAGAEGLRTSLRKYDVKEGTRLFGDYSRAMGEDPQEQAERLREDIEKSGGWPVAGSELSAEKEASADVVLGVQVAALRALDPITGAGLDPDARVRAAGQRLADWWGHFDDKNLVFAEEELGPLVDDLLVVDEPVWALLVGRMQAALRGFSLPQDYTLVEKVLPKVLGDERAEMVLAVIGEQGAWRISLALLPPGPDYWDPQGIGIHPLLGHSFLRQEARDACDIDNARDRPEPNDELWGQVQLSQGARFTAQQNWTEAKAVFAEALPRLEDKSAGLVGLAILNWQQGKDALAQSYFDRARLNTANLAQEQRAEGVFYFSQGRFDEAITAMRVGWESASMGDGGIYPLIYAQMAALRMGSDLGEKELRRAVERRSPKQWPVMLARYLLGEVDQSALLKRARQGFAFEVAGQMAEAYFARAQKALAVGDREEAVAALQQVVAIGFVNFWEDEIARRQLQELAPESLAPRREERPDATEETEPQERPEKGDGFRGWLSPA